MEPKPEYQMYCLINEFKFCQSATPLCLRDHTTTTLHNSTGNNYWCKLTLGRLFSCKANRVILDKIGACLVYN